MRSYIAKLKELDKKINGSFDVPASSSYLKDIQTLEEKLDAQAEHNRRLNAALQGSVQGVSKLDDDGIYLEVDDTYARLLDTSAQELIGKSWIKTVDPADVPAVTAAYVSMQDNGFGQAIATGKRFDGSSFRKLVTLVKPDKSPGYYCFMVDLTRLENERRRE